MGVMSDFGSDCDGRCYRRVETASFICAHADERFLASTDIQLDDLFRLYCVAYRALSFD